MELKYYEKKSVWKISGTTVATVFCFSMISILLRPSIDESNKKMALEVNKSCPRIIDSFTRLDKMLALSGNKIQFNLSFFNVDKGNVEIITTKEEIKQITESYLKTNTSAKIFRDNNTTLLYNYYDKSGNYLFDFIVSPENYNK